MQHRYFGDVGDFGKYGLLRVLCGLKEEPQLRLGIIWYLFPDEGHNEDGKHVHYLRDKGGTFRNCDDDLYDKLRSLILDDEGRVIAGSRHLSFVETSALLPEDSLFYSVPLSYGQGMPASARLNLRNEWFRNALEAVAQADIVFLDPDNGIECKSVARTKSKGPKYAFWDDIDALIARGQSVVAYHHLGRTGGSHPEQVESKLGQINERYGDHIKSTALIFRRGTNRAYFIIAQPGQWNLFRDRLGAMNLSQWNSHFKLHVR